ncbi:MAG: hypothetical protein V4850_34870 [Myxococcota bacterium]
MIERRHQSERPTWHAACDLVTVVDANPVNGAALALLFEGFNRVYRGWSDRMTVLQPAGEVSAELMATLRSYAVARFVAPCDHADDPYRVKFLLVDYVRAMKRSTRTLLYLDPDHLVLGPFPAHPPTGSIQVSSEVKGLPGPLAAKLRELVRGGPSRLRHFNTSFIAADYQSWDRVVRRWETIYQAIRPLTEARHREEIAFCVAALSEGLDVTPVGNEVQGSMADTHPAAALFHYGGEHPEARKVKACLGGPMAAIPALEQLWSGSLPGSRARWMSERALGILRDAGPLA